MDVRRVSVLQLIVPLTLKHRGQSLNDNKAICLMPQTHVHRFNTERDVHIDCNVLISCLIREWKQWTRRHVYTRNPQTICRFFSLSPWTTVVIDSPQYSYTEHCDAVHRNSPVVKKRIRCSATQVQFHTLFRSQGPH